MEAKIDPRPKDEFVFEGYFNYSTRVAESGWERRQFLGAWRRLNSSDRRWTPPYHPALRAALQPGRTPWVERQQPACLWLEALPGKPNYSGTLSHRQLTGAFMEQPVATALILSDSRRRDGTASLALFGCANDEETLERLLALAHEQAWARGRTRLVGPVALSPHLGQGALISHFSSDPPLHTPYQAPYLPEVLAAVMTPVQRAHLYHAVPVAGERAGPATLRPLAPDDLAATIPHLLTALDGAGEFPPPDDVEARFILEWWQLAPLLGVVAELEGEAVGVVMLQPDLAPALRWARGAANPLRRLWWQWRRTRRTRAGRALALVVLPAWRRRGVGAQLWQAGLRLAHTQGWQTLTLGPVVEGTPGAACLAAWGATTGQRYQLYLSEG